MAKKQATYALLGTALGVAGAVILTNAYRRARALCPPFHRRVYSHYEHLLSDLRFFAQHPGELRSIRSNPALNQQLMGRIMLAVTGVNGCRYCSYAHASYALRQGIDQDQVRRLLAGSLEDVSAEEAPALLFAQHYAETGGQPGAPETRRLVESYGSDTAHDLLALARLITMGNLIGNTFDALISRILGQPSPDSTLRSELAVLLLSLCAAAPLMGGLMVYSALTNE